MPASPAMRRVEVRAPSGAYEAWMGHGILPRIGETLRTLLDGTRRAVVVLDSGLPDRWRARLSSGLDAAGVATVESRQAAHEAHKNLGALADHLRAMSRARMERREPVIALGGGITGDVAGFAAAVYRRGVPWINCPTTLLAMVDASIGGKTGVNLDLGSADHPDLKKNMVGAFHQPRLVAADVDVLSTLPDRELRCGLAECVKHGLLSADFGDAALLEWTGANVDRVLSRDPNALVELVARNVAVKAAVVAGDEREEADDLGRAVLNLGHTFGHAIEPLPNLSPAADPTLAPLRHGEAVALGLVAACRTASAMGMGDPGLEIYVRTLLGRMGLPTACAGLPPSADLLDLMAHDKKSRRGRLRLVLPSGPGRCRVVADAPRAAVAAGLDAIRA